MAIILSRLFILMPKETLSLIYVFIGVIAMIISVPLVKKDLKITLLKLK